MAIIKCCRYIHTYLYNGKYLHTFFNVIMVIKIYVFSYLNTIKWSKKGHKNLYEFNIIIVKEI